MVAAPLGQHPVLGCVTACEAALQDVRDEALRLRDQRCRAEGCEIPATWCEAHHQTPWARGGRTDLDDGVLRCSWHHHRAHDRRYRTEILPSGDHRFHRRT